MRKGRTQASAYDAALNYLTSKARTVREVELHLDEGDYSEGEIMQTVDRLISAGLLDDRKYAHDFIESRLNTKPVSRRKLHDQLEGHFVPKEIIDEELAEVSDETEKANAMDVACKFFRQFSSLELSERLRRVGSRLVSRGYDYDCVRATLERITEEYDELATLERTNEQHDGLATLERATEQYDEMVMIESATEEYDELLTFEGSTEQYDKLSTLEWTTEEHDE